MKKITMTFLLFILLLTALPACAPKKEPKFSEEEFLNSIEPNLECLNSCALEIFCAEVDFETEYWAAYTNEDSYKDGLGDADVLYLPKDKEKYAQYFIDPSCASYYTVMNFKTNDDVRKHLRTYMADDVIDKWFHDDFFEYNDSLFLQRGARGYGALKCDMETLKYIQEKDGKHYVTIDFTLFDEYERTDTLEFSKSESGWIITAYNQSLK